MIIVVSPYLLPVFYIPLPVQRPGAQQRGLKSLPRGGCPFLTDGPGTLV